MSEWEEMFGEAGMRDDFIDSLTRQRQTGLRKRKVTLVFPNGSAAMEWAKRHPGEVIVRHPDGDRFIARTYEWTEEYNGDTFCYLGSEKNVHDFAREENQKKRAVSYAGECMGRDTYVGAQWLYENGHREMLLALHAEHMERMVARRGRREDDFLLEHRLKKELGEKLVALMPSDFDEVKWRVSRWTRGGPHIICTEGWLGEHEA